jgi:hypothetical protein
LPGLDSISHQSTSYHSGLKRRPLACSVAIGRRHATQKENADVFKRNGAFDHIGILFDGPPGGGMPFNQSSVEFEVGLTAFVAEPG